MPALLLVVALDTLAGVDGAPLPADGEAEALAQACDGAVRCVRTACCSDLPMQTVNVGVADLGHLGMLKSGKDVKGECARIGLARRWPLLAGMFVEKALGEVS